MTVLEKKVGGGAYGSVYKAILGETTVAVKRNFIERKTNNIGSLREVDILMKCKPCTGACATGCHHENHPYIINLISVSYEQPFDGFVSPPKEKDARSDDLYLIFEYMENNLQSFLDYKAAAYGKSNGTKQLLPSGLTHGEAREIAFQILVAIQYLHSKRIIHRDIKPANFLINKPNGCTDSKNIVVKICDFGLSRHTSSQANMTPRIMTPVYRAPEICWDAHDYGTEIDAWSVGGILYQLITGRPLITVNRDDNAMVLQQIYRKHPEPLPYTRFKELANNNCLINVNTNLHRSSWTELLRGADNGYRQIVVGLLNMDPQKRWSCTQALEHGYWQLWKPLLTSIHGKFPIDKSTEIPYAIEYSEYTRLLLNTVVEIVNEYQQKSWFSYGNIFILINLIYRYSANINLQHLEGLIHDAQLHAYILLYMVIKYSTSLTFNPSWDEVVPWQFRSPLILQYANQYEKMMLEAINFQIYTVTPYDIAQHKLSITEITKLLSFMIENPKELQGRLPSEIFKLALP